MTGGRLARSLKDSILPGLVGMREDLDGIAVACGVCPLECADGGSDVGVQGMLICSAELFGNTVEDFGKGLDKGSSAPGVAVVDQDLVCTLFAEVDVTLFWVGMAVPHDVDNEGGDHRGGVRKVESAIRSVQPVLVEPFGVRRAEEGTDVGVGDDERAALVRGAGERVRGRVDAAKLHIVADSGVVLLDCVVCYGRGVGYNHVVIYYGGVSICVFAHQCNF